MKFLLDTNICIYWLKGNETIEQKALAVGLDTIAISFINLSELYYGAYKSQKIKKNIEAIETLRSKIGFIDSNEETCKVFGEIKATLEKKGKIIDDADIFIAACAIINDVKLVTNNEKHFQHVKSLSIENWLKQTK